jgi:adenosine deaminase
MRARTLATLATMLLALGLGTPVGSAAARAGDGLRTARYLESVRADPARLHALLLALPKGADLHNHLSGAVSTETLIRLAVNDGLCIVTATLTAEFAPAGSSCPPGERPAADTTTDRGFYEQVLQAWSMEGFTAGAESGHDHFFATFGKFGAATARKGDLLADVASTNARQHVLYLETLVSRQGDAVRALAQRVGFDPDFAAMRSRLLAAGMPEVVKGAIAETDDDLARFDTLLGCRTRTPQPGCGVTIRFDYQVGRATDPATVFTNLLLGFELQRADRRYVGVNLVQPEDNPVALRDYTLQMRMIGYLRRAYPDTHVTLHAGELTPGLVSDPADVTFHIRQAVEIAGAERIGHGVSLVSEADYPGLLREMARRHVLVEAPLTSNAQILGVSGLAHPFWRYRAAHVPLALATDDPGVSRIDITHEYALATTEYGLRYPSLRKLSRASLEHAFLPGRSLWRAPDVYVRGSACRHDTPGSRRLSPHCGRLLRTSRKADVQWKLETRLRRFERRVARMAATAGF